MDGQVNKRPRKSDQMKFSNKTLYLQAGAAVGPRVRVVPGGGGAGGRRPRPHQRRAHGQGEAAAGGQLLGRLDLTYRVFSGGRYYSQSPLKQVVQNIYSEFL